jgi:threonine dehydrogenase-like Zn-dependent dehydrogenase
MFAKAAGSEVEVVARRQASAEAAERAGADRIWQPDEVPRAGGANWNGYSAVIEASGAASAPGRCAMSVEPGGRLVLIGVAGQASLIDTRHLVTNDITAIGILGGSLGLRPALAAYGSRDVIPDSLVSQVISLDQVSQAFAAVTGQPKPGAPKVQVNPSL